jgi:hypothetical protein
VPCIDISGCFKDHCVITNFAEDYQKIIIKAHEGNKKCRKREWKTDGAKKAGKKAKGSL